MITWLFSSVAQAQTATAAASAAKPGMGDMLVPFAAIMFIFYFLMMRPQQKKMKEHQNFLQTLKKGDQVLTTGGIFGEVWGITDLYITLQIADQVRIKILRSQIAKLAKDESKPKEGNK